MFAGSWRASDGGAARYAIIKALVGFDRTDAAMPSIANPHADQWQLFLLGTIVRSILIT